MGAILNGLIVHGGFRAFGATFFVFSDYMRPAVRLACIMGLPVIYVWTHDSIGLGEDGPTHQPIEHLASLRAMPHMRVIRPADATETAEAWRLALERTDGPVGLALSRQKLPVLDRTVLAPASGVRRGGYVLADTPRRPRRDPDRLGLRGARSAGRARDAERRGRRRARRLAARLEPLHGAAAELPRRGAAARRLAARLARGRRDVRLAGARRRARNGASGSIATAPRRPRRSSRASSGSRPRRSSQRRAPCSSSNRGLHSQLRGVFEGCSWAWSRRFRCNIPGTGGSPPPHQTEERDAQNQIAGNRSHRRDRRGAERPGAQRHRQRLEGRRQRARQPARHRRRQERRHLDHRSRPGRQRVRASPGEEQGSPPTCFGNSGAFTLVHHGWQKRVVTGLPSFGDQGTGDNALGASDIVSNGKHVTGLIGGGRQPR